MAINSFGHFTIITSLLVGSLAYAEREGLVTPFANDTLAKYQMVTQSIQNINNNSGAISHSQIVQEIENLLNINVKTGAGQSESLQSILDKAGLAYIVTFQHIVDKLNAQNGHQSSFDSLQEVMTGQKPTYSNEELKMKINQMTIYYNLNNSSEEIGKEIEKEKERFEKIKIRMNESPIAIDAETAKKLD